MSTSTPCEASATVSRRNRRTGPTGAPTRRTRAVQLRFVVYHRNADGCWTEAMRNFRKLRHGEVRRTLLPGTDMKIALTAAHFDGFGVARQGPWITWVNNEKRLGFIHPSAWK